MAAGLFPTEGSGRDADIEGVDQLARGVVTVDYAVLHVVDGIGDIYVRGYGVDREPVVYGSAALDKGPHGKPLGGDVHTPYIVVDPVYRAAGAVGDDLRGGVAEAHAERLLDGERLGVDAVERRGLVSVGAALVSAVGDGPQFAVAVGNERRGLYAHLQLRDDPVGAGVDLEQAVLVGPAVDVDVVAYLHHLLRRGVLGRHARAVDISRDLVPLRVDDTDARVPYLCHVGLRVGYEVHVPRGCETRDAPHLAEGRKVDGEDDVRVVDHDPPQIAVYGHRLRHVAQLHAVGACEDLVLDGVRGGVVVGEGGVAVQVLYFANYIVLDKGNQRTAVQTGTD